MKKFLLMVAALVGVSLVLIGCPTDADAGAAGAPGSAGKNVGSVNTDVDVAYLAALFKARTSLRWGRR